MLPVERPRAKYCALSKPLSKAMAVMESGEAISLSQQRLMRGRWR